MAQAPKSGSAALQQERRRALIEATMSAILEQGLSNLTLARVASLAGLTAGTVNFYFNSKEALLLETLKTVAEEFDQAVQVALEHAAASAPARLEAIILASLEPAIIQPRKVAVWYAFMAEAHARRDYQEICGYRDRRYFGQISQLCREVTALADPPVPISAGAIAHAVSGLIDELWQGVLFTGEAFDRKRARTQCLAFLASVFPWAYTLPAGSDEDGGGVSKMKLEVAVRRASLDDLAELSRLFDLYRQFYAQPSDRAGAREFLRERLANDESVIFIAEDSSGQARGFTQLYPAICSVALRRYFVLYDLYVDRDVRAGGIGRALMRHAHEFARECGALRVDLETAIDNVVGQSLYESIGYVRDLKFYKYSLDLRNA